MNKKEQIKELKKQIDKNIKKNKSDDNIEIYKKIIELNPSNVNDFLRELGTFYEEKSMIIEAIDCYKNILKTEKQNISTIGVLTNQIGVCYYNIKHYESAIEYFKKVLLIKEIPDVYCNIGQCNIGMKNYKEAEKNLLIAFHMDRNPKSCNSLGQIYYYMKQYDKSIEYYKYSSEIDDQLLYNLSFSYLSKREFKIGFHLYENRLKRNNINSQTKLKERLDVPLNYWNGIDKCENLLIVQEQGLGDNIQYYRFVVELSNRYPEMKIRYFCKEELSHIYKTYNNINIIKNLFFFNFEYKIYVMSLPKILGLTTIVPNSINYINTNETKLQFWREKMQNMKFKVAFTYSGLLNSFIDKNIPLQFFEALTELDITLICLHRKKDIENDLSKITFSDKITYYDIDTDVAFEDTICLLQNIDLLVTIDTYIVHLAGVLGIKTWLLLGTSEWRWSDNENSTYWYNSVELIRTKKDEQLNDLIKTVKTKLELLIN